MIEQKSNQLILTFPTEDLATTFAAFLSSLFQTASQPVLARSEPPFGPSPETILDSPAPAHSRRVVLTDDRLEQLANQRTQGVTAHQRLLRAQTTLRDGVLPFSKPGQTPAPSGQPSPRIKAQAEGGFADGSGEMPEAARRVRLRPAKNP